MKIVVYGMGQFYQNRKYLLPKEAEIVAFANSDESRATSVSGIKFENRPILKPSELVSVDFDYLYICTAYFTGIDIFESLKSTEIDLSKVRFLNRCGVTNREWNYEIFADGTIMSNIGDIVIHERRNSDLGTIAEIYAEHTYDINITEKSIVIDFGMNVGMASLFFAGNPNVNKVYGFEPFPDTYQMALDNFELNNEEIKRKIIPYNAAVTDREGYMDVAVETDVTGWRSLFVDKTNAPKIRIKCLAAADVVGKIVDESDGNKIIIKCDTEGSEFLIFESLGKTNLLKKIDAIVMEYHRNPMEILNLLEKNGYRWHRNGTNQIGNITAFHIK